MENQLDELLPLYWGKSEYINAWRLCFENEETKRLLLSSVLHHFPAKFGRVSFLEDFPGDRFIVLFTHDFDNVGGRENEAEVLFLLAETRAITFFGVEGARGPFNVEPYRTFPDRDITRGIMERFLKTFKVNPIEQAAINCTDPIFLWGIENEELYLSAQKKYRTGASDYWTVIEQRAPVLFENLLTKMEEMDVAVAGVCLTGYNFSVGHQWLNERKIAHAGIRAADSGITQWGRLDSALQNEPYDEEEATEWEMFADWRRPRGKRYRGAKPSTLIARLLRLPPKLQATLDDGTIEIISKQNYWSQGWAYLRNLLQKFLRIVRRF